MAGRGEGRGKGINRRWKRREAGARGAGRRREQGKVGELGKAENNATRKRIARDTPARGGGGEGGAAAGTQEDAMGVERRKPRLLHWSAFSELCMRLVMRDWANIEIYPAGKMSVGWLGVCSSGILRVPL